jgi:EmrB/QacA subfamily drug resistance transporter
VNAVAPDPRRWKALILICTAIFVVVLDIAIVNVALPSIKDDLGFAEKNLQWVITAYGLTYGGFLLLGGRAADLLGRRLVFMGGLALFTVASLVCGLSTSSAMLIVARGVQGLGAAIVTPAALSIISTTFTEGSERNKALGVWGAVGGSGAAAGVLMGGILTKYLGWEWIFWVNVPVGLTVLLLTPFYVRESRREDVVHDYDIPGAVSVTAGLIVLVYAISEAPQVGWGTFRTIGLIVLSGILLAFFLIWEWRETQPLMPLSIFRIRLVAAANFGGFLLAGGMYGTFLL